MAKTCKGGYKIMDLEDIAYFIAHVLADNKPGLRWQQIRSQLITHGATPTRCDLTIGLMVQLGHIRRVYDVVWATSSLYEVLRKWELRNIP